MARVATSPVEVPQGNGDSVEALAELQAILTEASSDSEFLRELQEHLRPFMNKASDDMKEDVPFLELARNERFAAIVQKVSPGVLAQLSSKVM